MGKNLIKNSEYLGAIDQVGPNRLRPAYFKSDYRVDEKMAVGDEGQFYSDIPEATIWECYKLRPDQIEEFGLEGVEKAWYVFGNHVCWHGWFWQELTLEPGRYTLTVPVYPDVYNWEDGKKVAPNLHLDSPKERAMRIQLRGGTENSVWFDEGAISNPETWYLHPWELNLVFEVTTQELHDVGIEVWAPWPIKNVGLVMGQWSLERVGEVEPEPDVDYEVTVHTPYQDPETPEENLARYDRVYEQARESLGTLAPSVDDMIRLTDVICPSGKGGIGILYDVPEDRLLELEDYVFDRSTHTRLKLAYTDPEVAWAKFLLAQGDERWSNHVYKAGECYTLASQGCWIADCAMAQRIWAIKADATPVTVDETIGPEGYSGCLMRWSAMPELGLRVVKNTTDKEEAQAHLDGGGLLFIEVEPTDLQHFVLGVEHNGYDFVVLDPWKNKVGELWSLYVGAESFRLIERANPEPEPEEPQHDSPGTLPSLHLQTRVPGDLEYVQNVKPAVIKVFAPDWASEFKAVSPDTKIIYRHYWAEQPLTDPKANAYAYAEAVARAMVGYFTWIDYAESYNEMTNSNDPDNISRVADFNAWYAIALNELTGGGVAPGLLPTACGNPYESEVELLIPAVEQCVKFGGVLCYHGYLPVGTDVWDTNGNLHEYDPISYVESDARWYNNRWMWWDKAFREHDLFPLYALLESGLLGVVKQEFADGTYYLHMLPTDGWKSNECARGNFDLYVQEIKRENALIDAWNAKHGNRCLGYVLFTSGIGTGWDSFQVRDAEFDALATALS